MLKSSVAKMTCPMKQFFSYLGASLAAIAALASCNKEIEAPVEDLNGGVPFEICASAVDTKTAIDGFATRWEADDAINLFHAVADSKNYISDGNFTITSENLATNKFTGNLAGELTGDSYDWYAFYPYSKYVTTPASTSSGFVTVGGTSQTQNGNSSNAHLCGESCPLYGIAKTVASDVAPSIVMNHLASIIEVNVTNNSGKDLTVTSVSFTGTEDIVGTYYIDFTQDPVVYRSSGESYVSKTALLSVTGGEAIGVGSSAKFYIAIKPFNATTGQTLKVAVNGCEKYITLTKNVSFTAGKIKKINIDYDGIQTTYIWDLSTNSTSEATDTKIAWTNDVADMVCLKGESTTNANNYYPGTGQSSTRFYKNSTLSITPKDGKRLTYYVFEATTTNYASALANSTWTNASVVVDGNTVTVVAKDPSVAVSATIGATCGFTRVECHTNPAPTIPPVINASPDSFNVEAAGNVYTINYSIDFPVYGKSISAKSNQDWVNTFDYDTAGEISFVVDENTGDARIATVTLSYEGAENVTITVAQESASSVTYTALFGNSYNSTSVKDYTSTWSATNNNFTVVLKNWNNNQNGWNYIKAGSKNSASVATITTNAAISEAITKVSITINAVTASYINSITLYCGDSANKCTTILGTFTIATGEQSVTITSPTKNKFYKISADCDKSKSNGTLTVSKVVYTKE